MKRLIIFLVALLPLGVFAQEMKIAFVDAQAVFFAMPEMSTIEKELADLNERYTGELKQMQDEYTKKYQDFVGQQETLTENIRLRRMQEIEDLQTRIENFIPAAQQDVQRKQQELFQPVQEKLQRAIQDVGAEKGYTYIIDIQTLLYQGSGAIDATPFVRAKLGLQ